jgi:undecaprenyl pyrophosphate synthase
MMITEHEEIARYRVAENIRTAESHALFRNERAARRAARQYGPRHELASALRRLADRLEPHPRQRRTGLSVVR